jgi:hypothetical protein
MSSTCPDIRTTVTCTASKVLQNLQSAGALFWASREVYLVREVKPFYDPTIGYIGQMVVEKTPVTPTPKITIRDQFKSLANIVTKVGDAAFDMIPQNLYTKSQLENADYWEIDGEQWNLVPGTLKDDPMSVFWSGVLVKVPECAPVVTV